MITLEDAYRRLSPAQETAIQSDRNTVVLAGPGSGKTDTIVLKAAHLLRDVLPSTRSVAVLTFNNDTAREIAERLRRFGQPRSRRLYCGTLHSYALNSIVRSFAAFVSPPVGPLEVISETRERSLWLKAFEEAGLVENPDWSLERRIRTRRSLAMGEDVSYEDDRLVQACVLFDSSVDQHGLIDFEGIILRAFSMLRQHPELAASLVRRYPWVLVDEYQDLGIVLHRLTLLLVEAGARVLAVGDPDQSIYGFTGAEPHLMHELHREAGFAKIDLEFNYRSGSRIIVASYGALGEDRATKPAPDRSEPGMVAIVDVEGGIDDQAVYVATEAIPQLLDAGVPAEEIAVLYSARGQVPDAMKASLDDAGIPFVAERDTRFPGGQVGRWLQRCARRGVDPESLDAEPLTVLLADLQRWLPPFRNLDGMLGLRSVWRLVRAAGQQGTRLNEWLRFAEGELKLLPGLQESDGAADADDYSALLEGLGDPALGSTLVAEYAEGARVAGKIILTTYHSSKGRQFDAVILPALQDQLMPRMRWDRFAGRMAISDRELSEQRRLFYVGFTRARSEVILISSAMAANDKGFLMPRSRFVGEVTARLAHDIGRGAG